jgi:CHAT domain-containing protein
VEASRVRLAAEYDLVQRKLVEAYQTKSNGQVEDLTRKLRDVRDRQNTAVSMLRRSSPHLASLRYPNPLNVEKAQKSLDTGTLALSFNVNKETSLLFALGPEGTFRVSRLAVGSEDLRRQVGQFVELLREQTMAVRRDSLLMKAQHLFRELFGAIDDLIAHSSRIILIPDGPLHALPFAALVRDSALSGEESWQFLAEYKPLHIVSSLTTHSLQRTLYGRYSDAGACEELVAFGDPAYPSGTGGRSSTGDPYVRAASTLSSLEPLPWSRREVERIVELFPGRSSLYLGNQATEHAAKTTLVGDKHRYVHFAAHGYLDQQFPLNSAVVLTMPAVFQSGEENGLLQTWEVLEQVRLDADLVVLSACESGLGKEMGGEGLIGLTRAFQYAGARSVIASLWKISDRTTAEFMVRFYRHLKEGLSKDEALRATQMEFIRGPIQVTNDKGERVDFDASAPYYWAAFQIYGDWQ